MKNKLGKSFLLLPALFCILAAHAQSPQAGVKTILTADSLKTGNWKDVLTSFFQLGFNGLTGSRKEINFQSNAFAVLLRSRPELAIDTNYVKYKTLRKLNFGFGLNLDTNYRFNGFTSGIRYALINKRDVTTSDVLFNAAFVNDTLRNQVAALFDEVSDSIELKFANDISRRGLLIDQLDSLRNSRTQPFDKLDPALQGLVKNIATKRKLNEINKLLESNPSVSVAKVVAGRFSDFKKELQNALLWTVSLTDTTYKDQFFFSNILLKTDLLKGVGKPKPGANWELNLQAGVNFVDDSTRKGRDLSRSLFRFEPGVNLVFRNGANDQSWFEAKFSGSYLHNFGTLYTAERRDSVTFNATLRVRIIGDIWIPLEIKYDPRNGNVFGFLNVRFNFNGQAKKPTPQS